MSALLRHVALVSQSEAIDFPQLARVAAALQKQASRDFGPIWKVSATVDPFATLDDVPTGYWPIIIRDDIGYSGAAGIHLDKDGQPFALVQAGTGTPITCSHELLEMLADPFGNRFVASDSIKPGQGRVRYLVEVCDPSEDSRNGYSVNGILVSDFYTPNYFDPVTSAGVRYSFTNAVKRPKQVVKGGYLSWQDPTTGKWWQATYFGTSLAFTGPHNWKRSDGKSWRETIDSNTRQPLKSLQGRGIGVRQAASAAAFFSPAVAASSTVWARSLTREIEGLLK